MTLKPLHGVALLLELAAVFNEHAVGHIHLFGDGRLDIGQHLAQRTILDIGLKNPAPLIVLAVDLQRTVHHLDDRPAFQPQQRAVSRADEQLAQCFGRRAELRGIAHVDAVAAGILVERIDHPPADGGFNHFQHGFAGDP